MTNRKAGRPRVLTEEMTTVRVRTSQRKLLTAMKLTEVEAHHQVLSRVLKDYFQHNPKVAQALKRHFRKATAGTST